MNFSLGLTQLIGRAVRAIRGALTAPAGNSALGQVAGDQARLYDAALRRLIRERFKCNRNAARAVFDCYREWQCDAACSPYRVSEDGRLLLGDIDALDRCAANLGLPVPEPPLAPSPAAAADWFGLPSELHSEPEVLLAGLRQARDRLLDGALADVIQERYRGAGSHAEPLDVARRVRDAALRGHLRFDEDGRLLLGRATLRTLDRFAAGAQMTPRTPKDQLR